MRQGILIREWLVVEDELGWSSDSSDGLELLELSIVKIVDFLLGHEAFERLGETAR